MLYPIDETAGLVPQRGVWSPNPINTDGNYVIAFIYNGNIWLVNSATGVAQQLTADGLTSNIDWR